MNGKIEAIVFDYGGTLDTDGIHWAEKFWEAYSHFQIPVSKEEFRNAFVYSERKIPGIIKPNFSLINTYQTQITYQLEYLVDNKILGNIEGNLGEKLTELCYQSTKNKLPNTIEVLEKLKENFVLGLVSNYYGNVKTILTELGLDTYFDNITDSTIVGIRKPDSRIFEHIISEMNVHPNQVIVVGDSYKNDITPAKSIGCGTIWIKVRGWNDNDETENADIIIESLKDLPQAIRNLISLFRFLPSYAR